MGTYTAPWRPSHEHDCSHVSCAKAGPTRPQPASRPCSHSGAGGDFASNVTSSSCRWDCASLVTGNDLAGQTRCRGFPRVYAVWRKQPWMCAFYSLRIAGRNEEMQSRSGTSSYVWMIRSRYLGTLKLTLISRATIHLSPLSSSFCRLDDPLSHFHANQSTMRGRTRLFQHASGGFGICATGCPMPRCTCAYSLHCS